jgi:hypothetical protein
VNFLASLRQKAVWSRIGILLVLLGLVAGCRRDGVQVYRVPKETQASAPAASAVATAAPEGWEAAPPGQMRVASFRIKGKEGKTADMGVIPLPGKAGSDLANVNRWRGQVGLVEVDEAELVKLQEEVEIAGSKGQLYDFTGENAASGEKTRMLAAVLRKNDTAWFFKMTGDDGLVGEQKPAFLSYLKTFQFPSESSQTGVAVSEAQPELPPNHPPIGGSATPGPGGSASIAQTVVPPSGADAGKPVWKVPANWQETSGGQFLVAKFLIAGPNNGQAAVNVSSSGGNGGGLLMNVNRWRQQQLGLPPVDEAGANELAKPLDAGAAKAMLVDMTGQDARTGDKARIVAVIVPQGSQTWVYKLMGPVSLVEQEKDNFLKFVQTAQYKP